MGCRKILQNIQATEIKKSYRPFLSLQILIVETDKLDWSTLQGFFLALYKN